MLYQERYSSAYLSQAQSSLVQWGLDGKLRTILDTIYVWFNQPEIIMQLIELNKLSSKMFAASVRETMDDEAEERYARLMRHDKWRRGRGGAIRQLHTL